MSLPEGTAVGPYRIVAPIGAGGMGEVYRAHDPTLQRDVAIKILPDALTGDADRLARVLREAQVLAALNHPNIAAIYGVESHRGTRALVMELVTGEDLATLLARGPLPSEDALPIARQVAEALEAAHEQGIVHRDLKPANIKVREDGSVKVLDFGLAKMQSPISASGPDGAAALAATLTSPALTAQGIVLGTAAYMAPEQARGRAVDKRADIWSFGVVLYEMLTGVRPFQADSVADTLAAVLTREVDLTRLPATAPAGVATLLRRCLERDPKLRLRDIGEARVLLASPASSTAPTPALAAGPARVAEPVPTRVTRRQLLAMAGGGVALFGGGVGAGLWLGRAPEAPTSPLLVRPLTFSGTVISATISPDGRLLAYVESEQGQQSLWVRQVGSGQTLRLIADASVAYWSHTFTPDGNEIVFGQRSIGTPFGALYAISTLGGTPRRLVDRMDSPPAFSPDGRRMAFARLGATDPKVSSVILCDPDGADERTLASVQLPESVASVFYGAPSWSPDGTTIAIGVAAGQAGPRAFATRGARLALIDVESGTMTTLGRTDWLHVGQSAWLPDGRALLAVARGPEDTAAQLWRFDRVDGAARRITTGDGEFRIVSLTADGRTAVSVESTLLSTMAILPVAGGKAVRIGRARRDGLYGVAFLPDGRLVYTAPTGDDFAIWATTPDGATRSPLVDARNGESFSIPAASSDGSLVYLARTDTGLEMRLLPAGSARSRVVTRDVRADNIDVSPDGQTVVFTATVDGAPRLFRCAPDGTGRRQVSDRWALAPCIGPDGRTAAFFSMDGEQGFRILVVSIDSGAVLADLPSEPPPSGLQQIVLVREGVLSTVMPGDRANVWLRPLDGSRARKLTAFDEQEVFRMAVSRDGGSLAIVRGSRVRDAQVITGFQP